MGLVVILASTVVAMSAVAQLWEDEWDVLLISLQVSKVGEGQGCCLPQDPHDRQSLYRSSFSAPRCRGTGRGLHSRLPSVLNWQMDIGLTACLVGRDGQQHAGDLRV